MSLRRGEVECPECGTGNPASSRFCETCGLHLVAKVVEAGTPPAPRKRRGKPRVADSERREVERAVGRARAMLKGVRGWLIVACVIYGVVTLLVWAATAIEHDPDVVLAATVCSVLTLLLLAATIFLYDLPLFWVLTVASVCTVATVLNPGVLGILMCISLWGAVPVLLDVARLQRRYPGLITREKLMRRERRGLSREAEARVEERAAERRTAAVRSYSVVAAVLVLGVATLVAATSLAGEDGGVRAEDRGADRASALSTAERAAREAAFATALRSFESAWASSDKRAVAALGSDAFRAEQWYKVEDILERRGWSERFPEIGSASPLGAGDEARQAWFAVTPKGKLKTHWVFEDGRWLVQRIVFSRTR